MKRILSLLTLAAIVASCTHQEPVNTVHADDAKTDTVSMQQDNCAGLMMHARKLDSILIHSSDFSKPMAEQAVEAFEAYAAHCQNDSLSPVFLIKGSQVAQSVQNISKSQALLEKCIHDYPGFKNRGAAMFLLAQLYDERTMLNNEAEAKKLYEQIIKEYPNTDWERNARAAMANLGRSDEDLVKEFMKKNKHS